MGRRTTQNPKARGEAVLKNLGDGLQEEIFQHLRRNTQAKTIAWLARDHDINLKSASTLSDFWLWYPRQCMLRRAARTSTQLEETIQKMPQLKLAAGQARDVAQVSFEIQAAENRDPELFGMLRKGELERHKLELEREKFEFSKKADIDKGLDALFEELKGNPEALTHYKAMRAALNKAKGAAA